MIKKIYDHEYWYPGIDSWWNKWQVNRKRAVLAKFDYSRLVNFKRVMDRDKGIMLSRHRIHMKQDFLMKNPSYSRDYTDFINCSQITI